MGSFLIRAGLLRQERASARKDGGFTMMAVIAAVFLITLGVIVLASRSSNSFFGSIRQTDMKKARETAELGVSDFLSKLNQDANGYLLVTEWPCWQSTAIDTTGIFMGTAAATANPTADRLSGVASNTSSKQWVYIDDNGAVQASAPSSGNYSRYQLVSYRAPRPTSDAAPPTSCDPTSPFGNRFGGSAFLQVRSEVYRQNVLQSQHALTEEVHVKSLAGTGESSFVLLNSGSLDGTKPFVDLNGNGVWDSGEPWLDIFCNYCVVGTTQAQLKANDSTDSPPGVGMNNSVINQYGGTIIAGKFKLPDYPFYDANSNGFFDPNTDDKAIPLELFNALSTSQVTQSLSPVAGQGIGGHPRNGGNAEVTAYNVPFSGFSPGGMTANITFCANNSSTAPCSTSVAGDVRAISVVATGIDRGYVSTPSSGSASATLTVNGAAIKTRMQAQSGNDSWQNNGFTPSDFDITYTVTNQSSLPPPVDIAGPRPNYPYTLSTGSTLQPECKDVTTAFTGKTVNYIGCYINNIDTGSGTSTVTVQTERTGKPVYLFIQGNVSMNGSDALANSQPGRTDLLQLYGKPPLTSNPVSESCTAQTLELSGTDSLNGVFAWFPRGTLQYDGGGTATNFNGLMWMCSYDGSGSVVFLGSKSGSSWIQQVLCGNEPCGLFKYRAQGIARVERVIN
jgi:hypothetical protein